MGSKQDPHRSYGQKIITLFVKLLFTRDEYSLGELAGKIHRRDAEGFVARQGAKPPRAFLCLLADYYG